MIKNKKALVIGGSGFLGSYIAEELIKKKIKVTIFDQKEPKITKSKLLSFVKSNLSNKSKIREEIKKNQLVYYFADIADIGEAKKKPLITIENNVNNLISILDFCAQSKPKSFIYGSSMYVYSESGSFYRCTKQIAEILIKEFAKNFKFNYQFFRYGSLYGKRSQEWNGIRKFISQIQNKGRIIYAGTGKEIREYVNVSDAAMTTVDLSLKNNKSNEVFTVSGNQSITIDQLFGILFEISGKKKRVKYKNTIVDDHYGLTPYRFVPDKSKKVIPAQHTDLGEGFLEIFKDLQIVN